MGSTKAAQRIRLTRSITRLTALTERLKKKLERLGYDDPKVAQRALFGCRKCSRKSRLKHWEFIRKYFYVRPYSCMEGDYWKQVGIELCHMVCPKCGEKHYIYNYPDKKRLLAFFNEEGSRVQEVFASVQDDYSRN